MKNEKSKRKIGIIICQPDKDFSAKLLSGLLETAFGSNYDVCVFSTFVKQGGNENRPIGELNIFNLINYDSLDGIVFVPDTFHFSGFTEYMEKELTEKFKDKPVVFVDIKSNKYPSIITDDTSSVHTLVNHFIDYHGFMDIAYLTGPKEHEHSVRRLKGYLDAMAEHGLNPGEDRIFYGDFWYGSGETVINELLKSKRPLPQAILCASDTMAISVCDALRKNGIHVPGQVSVAGYDAIEEGMEHDPSVTSMSLPAKDTGRRTMTYLISMLRGESFNDVRENAKIIKGHSCPCNENIPHLKHYIEENEFFNCKNLEYRDAYFFEFNEMLEDLISKENLNDFSKAVCWYAYQIAKYDKFAVCLNEDWCDFAKAETEYRRKGYSGQMMMPIYRFSCENGPYSKVDLEYRFDQKEMFPVMYEEREFPTAYFFTPLHFEDRTFGYSVISFGNTTRAFDLRYHNWIKNVSVALECLRRLLKLKNESYKNELNAVTDIMTGINNRNGFNIDSDILINECATQGSYMLLLMGDLNGLKSINDIYGHVNGDIAIQTAAKAVACACADRGRAYRIGGDEFAILAKGEFTREEIVSIKQNIRDYLDRFNAGSGKPYLVSISVGTCYTKVTKKDTVEHILNRADAEMFTAKQQFKGIQN